MPQFIPLSAVRIEDGFWQSEQALVRDVVLPYQWEILNDRVPDAEPSHCINNFRVAAGECEGTHCGVVFLDTDLYKWLEAVGYCLSARRDETLEALADGAIALIGRAQQKDGYLDTYYSITSPDKRWTNLMEGHELYCAGHYIEAAVAYHAATGKRECLDIAVRLADCIDRAFGAEEGKLHGYSGHPEIELALLKLYGATDNERYLRLARYFIDARGASVTNWFDDERVREGHSYIWPEMAGFKADYFQSQAPVREQSDAVGHAVRAMYLYGAMADLARIDADAALKAACERLYESVTRRKLYITGGIGSAALGERFTGDFDLPDDSVYAETCASIGLMLFASRMFLLDGDTRYYDAWELALRNTVLAGMGRDGRHFFYVNPLSVVPSVNKESPTLRHVMINRQKWFGVACCPPNIARTVSALGGMLYATDKERLYVLSHIASSFEHDGMSVALKARGDDYELTVDAPPMTIELHKPEGFIMAGGTEIRHNGGKSVYHYSLIPVVRLMRADPRVAACAGKACVMRGSTVYCMEEADNGAALSALYIRADAKPEPVHMDFLPKSMPALRCEGYRRIAADALYTDEPPRYERTTLTFVPYSQWNNRGEGEMRVWVNELCAPNC